VNQASFTKFEAETDDEGHYILRNLPVGVYEVRIEFPAFRTSAFSFVPVQSSAITQLNASLEIAATTEMVTVQSAAQVVNTSSANTSTLVENGFRLNGQRNIPVGFRPTATP